MALWCECLEESLWISRWEGERVVVIWDVLEVDRIGRRGDVLVPGGCLPLGCWRLPLLRMYGCARLPEGFGGRASRD
jgi:hypothetical protein